MILKLAVFSLALALGGLPVLAHADTTTTTTTTRTTSTQSGNWAGIQLGPNFSTFTNDGGAGGRTEFEVGGFVDWQLKDIWYLSTGLRYNTYAIGQSTDGIDASFHAHFIEIPVLLKPTFDAGGWYPFALIGPSFGFKTGEGFDATGNGASVSGSTSALKTFDFSMDFGVGAEVPILPNLRALAQFEYSLGLTDIAKDSSDGGTKSRGAMLMFGLMAGF